MWKYVAGGESGLIDRRGHHKADDEVDETKHLRRENQRLKRQLEEQERLVAGLLLKKNGEPWMGGETWQAGHAIAYEATRQCQAEKGGAFVSYASRSVLREHRIING